VAGDDSNKKYGVLNFDSKNRGILKLRGHLLNDLLDQGELTLFGESLGKKYTLFSAQMTHSEIKMSGPSLIARQEFLTNLIFVGVHINNQSEFKFTKYIFETHLLDSWLSTKDFKLSETEDKFLLAIKKPHNREFHIGENFDLAISYKNHYKQGSTNLEFRNYPHFESIHSEAISVGEFHRSVLIPVLNFMTLANANTDFIYNLTGICEEKTQNDASHDVRILSSFRMASAPPKIEKLYKRWIDPDSAELEEYLSKWLSLYRTHELILDEYFASKYNHNVYLEDQFFQISKTVDSWARTVIKSKKSISEEGQEILALVETVLPADQFMYLENRLKSSDSMKEFLYSLIAQQESVIKLYISNWTLFVKRLVETRNKYVHIVEKRELLTFEEMFVANNLLELILIHEMLRFIGLPAEIIRTKSETSVHLQIMRQAKQRMREDLQ